MIKTLKKIDSWLDEGTDGYWSTPFPDIMTQDIDRCKAKFNIKINPYCKDTVQKRKCVLAIVAIIIVLKILFGKDFGLVKTINSIPYWEFNDFVREAVGDSKVTAFWFYTIGCCGLSTLIISLLQTFLIGLKKTRLLSVDGICVWLMNVYICGLCSDICHPIALFCAKETFLAGNLTIEFLEILVALSLTCVFSESVKSVLAIYLSRPAFILFGALKLHYVGAFILLGINKIIHIELFRNINDWLCLMVVLFSQLLFKILELTGIYDKLIKLIKNMITFRWIVITPIILLPFAVIYAFIKRFL